MAKVTVGEVRFLLFPTSEPESIGLADHFERSMDPKSSLGRRLERVEVRYCQLGDQHVFFNKPNPFDHAKFECIEQAVRGLEFVVTRQEGTVPEPSTEAYNPLTQNGT